MIAASGALFASAPASADAPPPQDAPPSPDVYDRIAAGSFLGAGLLGAAALLVKIGPDGQSARVAVGGRGLTVEGSW